MYSDFKNLVQVKEKLGLLLTETKLFPQMIPIRYDSILDKEIERGKLMGYSNEKERSERLIHPVLTELYMMNQNKFKIHSGKALNVDESKGLTGECDFMLSVSKVSKLIEAPVFTLVEAKNENLDNGTAQCIAQMVGAKIFNEQQGKPQKAIYGCATIGDLWQFMKIEDTLVSIDTDIYYLDNLNKLLSALQQILNLFFEEKHT